MGIHLKAFFRPVLVVLLCCTFTFCSNDDYYEVTFIGDSITSKWDLKRCFPSTISHNWGKSGAGISYIESLEGNTVGKNLVILIGTNDYTLWDDTYVDRYIRALSKLNSEHIVLISILPRFYKGDNSDINGRINTINRKIKAIVSSIGYTYIDAYSKLMAKKNVRYEYYTDGLHLNEKGYELLTESINEAIL